MKVMMRMMNKNIVDCVVIGAGPAGLTASLYLARDGYSVICVGEEPGGTLNKISILENYPGFSPEYILSGSELANNMIGQCTKFGVQFEFFKLATKITAKSNQLTYIVKLSDNSELIGKSIIICTGTIPNVLNIPGEKEYLNDISFCATCDAPFYKDKEVAVIGGGNSAMDFTVSLSKYCKQIYMIHRRNSFKAESTMIEKVKSLKNVTFLMETSVTSIAKNDNKFHLNFNTKKCLQVDGLFYAIGFKENLVDISNVKNTKGIFFAGDCSNKHKQVITACGDGCNAALECIKYLTF